MTHPAVWFRTVFPQLPRALYPRTLVIAGTFAMLKGGFRPTTTDGTITFEETKLPTPPNERNNSVEGEIEEEESDQPQPSGVVSQGPAGSFHMSFHAQHSLLLVHPGVIAASINFLQTGSAE